MGAAVKRSVGYVLAFAMGVNAILLVTTRQYTRFVRPTMGPWLLLGGLVLTGAGLVRMLTGDPLDEHGAAEHDGHGHGHAHHGLPKVALLLVFPLAALYLGGARSLGTFAATRTSTVAVPPARQHFAALPVGPDGIATVDLVDVWRRATADVGSTLRAADLRLVGFAMEDIYAVTDEPSYLLSRYKIICCAADALIVQARIVGASPLPRAGTWIELVGTYVGTEPIEGGGNMPVVRVRSSRVIPEPQDPYE